MAGFRRAQLRGSEELFRSTEPNPVQVSEQVEVPFDVTGEPVPQAPAPDARSVRLTSAELQIIADALQHVKFPGKMTNRPSVEEFERLEELRKRLLSIL